MKKVNLFGMRIKTLSEKEKLSRDNSVQRAQIEALDIIDLIDDVIERYGDNVSDDLIEIKEKALKIDSELNYVICDYL